MRPAGQKEAMTTFIRTLWDANKREQSESLPAEFHGLAPSYRKAWRHFESFCVYISPALLPGNCTLT